MTKPAKQKAKVSSVRDAKEHALPRIAAGAKTRLSSKFIDETIAVWQPHYKQTLTREDARQIVVNVTGFFDVLLEWEQVDRTPRNTAS